MYSGRYIALTSVSRRTASPLPSAVVPCFTCEYLENRCANPENEAFFPMYERYEAICSHFFDQNPSPYTDPQAMTLRRLHRAVRSVLAPPLIAVVSLPRHLGTSSSVGAHPHSAGDRWAGNARVSPWDDCRGQEGAEGACAEAGDVAVLRVEVRYCGHGLVNEMLTVKNEHRVWRANVINLNRVFSR